MNRSYPPNSEPSSAEPSSAEPSSAEPSSAEPRSAEPGGAEPHSAGSANESAPRLGFGDEAAWSSLLAELPLHDLPAGNVATLRARMHQEFELSHAVAAEQVRRRSLSRFGRLAETAVVASVCVVHIVWLMQVVLRLR